MKKRTLGANGPEVTGLGLGCMRMSFADKPADKKEMIKVLHKAVDMGITFFDTAEVYGPFTNELLLGEAFSNVDKDKLFIATKFGFTHRQDGTRPAPSAGFDSRSEQIKRVAEESLKRLNVECLDLFYQHRVDPNVPIPGCRSEARLAENFAALDIELSTSDLSDIDGAMANIEVLGDRY